MKSVPQLVTQFVPAHYQLSLMLDRPRRTFEGTVTINGTSKTTARKILLHAKDLIVQSATVDGKNASFSIRHDQLTITHPHITPGDHVVVIGFSGKITDSMHGLYPCYFTHEGTKKELLATQFESHHAREVFPCIDEPAAKATFDLTLTTEPSITVLGNMPIKSQKHEAGQLVTTFETTPRMSTYLLAWVAGELHRKTATTKSGTEVNVWATPAQPAENLDFALDHAVRTIEFFNDYFGVPYPLPKSDHVALPDFTAGAMENWGLVTYREIALLAHPTISSISSRQYVALVIAHELSHQWFGNLVTMKWWNNLWLNESFASLMEYIALDALHPEWNSWLDFSTHESIVALRRDSIDGVQPVQTDVHHPDEISTLFDSAIVYAKGARLLRMLQQYIGERAFRAGLQSYFKKFAYQNTEGNDLWHEFHKASGKDIAAFMNQWISQPGYPVVKVTKHHNTLSLSQERFFIGSHQASHTIWPIPLGASARLPELLEEKTSTQNLANDSPVRLNISDSAHFITQYDPALLEQLVRAIPSTSPLDRLQLLHEQILLARAGATSSASLIPLLMALKNETSEAVWDMMALTISELKKFVETDKTSDTKLRQLAASLARQQYTQLGWQPQSGESETEAKLRATIIGLMLYGEDQQAIKTAQDLYARAPLEQLDPELRPLIIGATVRHSSDTAAFHTLLETYKKTASADLRDDIASGLTNARLTSQIKTLLSALQDRSTIRPQDVRHWFVGLIRHHDSRALTWQWLQAHWDWINDTFGSDKSYDDFPKYAASGLTTRQQLNEYKAFFTPLKQEPALTRVITLGISEIEARVALIEHDQPAVCRALNQL